MTARNEAGQRGAAAVPELRAAWVELDAHDRAAHAQQTFSGSPDTLAIAMRHEEFAADIAQNMHD